MNLEIKIPYERQNFFIVSKKKKKVKKYISTEVLSG